MLSWYPFVKDAFCQFSGADLDLHLSPRNSMEAFDVLSFTLNLSVFPFPAVPLKLICKEVYPVCPTCNNHWRKLNLKCWHSGKRRQRDRTTWSSAKREPAFKSTCSCFFWTQVHFLWKNKRWRTSAQPVSLVRPNNPVDKKNDLKEDVVCSFGTCMFVKSEVWGSDLKIWFFWL